MADVMSREMGCNCGGRRRLREHALAGQCMRCRLEFAAVYFVKGASRLADCAQAERTDIVITNRKGPPVAGTRSVHFRQPVDAAGQEQILESAIDAEQAVPTAYRQVHMIRCSAERVDDLIRDGLVTLAAE